MANRFLVAGGNGNWDSTTNWALTSGAASGQTAPVAGDVVAFDSLSGNAPMTVNVPRACASLIMSGTYAGTLTFTSTLTLTSTCTFLSTCTIAGTAGTLIISTGAQTITSGGKTLTCALTFATSATYTLGDNWTVNGLVTVGVTTGGTTINGNQITCAGGFHQSGTSASVQGTTKLVLTGGTWDSSSSGVFANAIDFAGNVTVSGTIIRATSAGTITYLSGTITTAGSTLSFGGGSFTLTTAGMTWANLTWPLGATTTLGSNLAWSGTITLNASQTFTGAGTISSTGAVSITAGATQTFNNTGGLVTTGTLTLPATAVTFAGTSGFTVGTLTNATYSASRIVTLTFGNTYTVTTTISNVGTAAGVVQSIVSGTPGSKVVFNLQAGATCDLIYCNPTDINSAGGREIVTTRGVITTSTNWVTSPTQPATTDVRSGTVYGGGTGSLVVPAASNVKSGVVFDNGTVGTLVVPTGGGGTGVLGIGL